MSVLTHLRKCAGHSIIKGLEKSNIKRSVAIVHKRLKLSFRGELSNISIFGSYTRGTLLPRKIDTRSDVDIMVVFSDNTYNPQTYLQRLKRFAEANYKKHEIYQSSPTIVLTLNHIKIELVPAIISSWPGLNIPAPASNFSKWLSTTPDEFNETLTIKNKKTGANIKPVIRIAKYWNALNNYVFSSYELEQNIVSQGYWWKRNLQDYFFSAMNNLELDWNEAHWKHDKLNRMHDYLQEIELEEDNGNNKNAQFLIRKLLPEYW